MELLSRYDPFLKEHIRTHGNKGQGITYLSTYICEEFIELVGKKVLFYIIQQLKKCKYFSISVNSTPDITHIDQLTFVVRYVTDEGPVARFFMFIPIEKHNAEYLFNIITKFIEENDININDCRGQSYDNASNMSGRYVGLQARIRDVNQYANYIPCAAHSLNLVGTLAAECVPQVVSFFSLVQKLYTFFSSSTYRWQTLVSVLKSENKLLKALSTTMQLQLFTVVTQILMQPLTKYQTMSLSAMKQDTKLNLF